MMINDNMDYLTCSVAEKNRACTMPQLLLQNIRGDLTGITDRRAEASVIIGRIDILNE